ncbi:Metallothionein expression activator [Sporothrix epigloea]|uniref:Metallothionein expression activator n=1 Tax=Sporothrix epigloea TaxID=1892477 RepID=A0ABP0D960_9PEZI
MKSSSSSLPPTKQQAAAAAAMHSNQESAQFQPQQKQQPSRPAGHRRGLSLDTRRQQLQQRQQKQQQIQQIQSQHKQQEQLMVASAAAAAAAAAISTPTNPGQHIRQEQLMQETQQQRTVRQGAKAQQIAKQSREQALFIAQKQRQQHNQQQEDCADASYDFYNGAAATTMSKSLSVGGLPLQQQDFPLFASPIAHDLQTSTGFMTFQDTSFIAGFPPSVASPHGWTSEDDTCSTRRASRRVSNGIMDRVSKFEGLAMDLQRPATPPYQNRNQYFPPTPTETPVERMEKQHYASHLDQFSDSYDESMESTIKPQRKGHHSKSSSGVFDDLRRQAEAMALATPPRSNMIRMPLDHTNFIGMNSMNSMSNVGNMNNINFAAMSVPADMQHLSPPQSQHPTPATIQGVFDNGIIGLTNAFTDKPDLWTKKYDSQLTMSPFGAAAPDSPPYTEITGASRHRSLHKRNESIASIASAASIASINIDETRTETGVTLDDIAIYIDGPSPSDGKWRCLYEGCDKRFGRKENIKSHVQTHLNDRQYQCPHCQKCFVRQHDLKRHAKIHTGVKPYPCECGNSFARHDALTRHRQRGMCIGAFDGAVRKVGKRGRPRKSRPSLDARREKSCRTRSKNKESCSSELSSHSGHSDYSAGNSPRSDESDSAFDEEPFIVMDKNMVEMEFGSNSAPLTEGASRSAKNPSALAVSSAPMPVAGISAQEMASIMPALSHVDHAAVIAASPSTMSHYSHVSHSSLPSCNNGSNDFMSSNLPTSPARSVASPSTHHSNTPSELSASSSPPQSSARFFDLNTNSSYADEDTVGLSAPLTSTCGTFGLDVGNLSSSSLDEEIMMMKAYTSDDVLIQLDDPSLSMLSTSKFDDEYGMFTNSDDFFFGNN